eukprot:189264_1
MKYHIPQIVHYKQVQMKYNIHQVVQCVHMSMCAYLDGYIYVFGGTGRNEISRINVGVHNEYFYSATWHTLTSVMPANNMAQGQAVVASNGKIYIGAMITDIFADKVYEFSPEDQIITEIENFKSNDGRPGSAF